MSNRQERKRRKAERRRKRVLAAMGELQLPGIDLEVEVFVVDGKAELGLVGHRAADALFVATVTPIDREWRRMEKAPEKMRQWLYRHFSRRPLPEPA